MRVTRLLVGFIMFFQGATGASAAGPEEGMSVVAKGGTSPLRTALIINLALKDGKFYLGEVCTRIVGDTPLSVERDGFLKAAAPVLRAEVAEEVRKLPAEADFVSLSSLKKMGLPVEFDLGQMTLSISPAVEQRPKGHISLSAGDEPVITDRFSKQSAVSGYVNLNAAAQYTGKSLSGNSLHV